jgi:hypothetical protein
VREWLVANDYLEEGPDMHDSGVRGYYYRYLAHVGRIVPEGFSAPDSGSDADDDAEESDVE